MVGSIIVALSKIEDAKYISNVLRHRGLETSTVCTSGSTVLSTMQHLDHGIVICSRRLTDMHYTQLIEYLPADFEMLLLAPKSVVDDCDPDTMVLGMPFRAADLIGTVEMMLTQQNRRLKKQKAAKKQRTEREQNYINNAKWLLMERNQMSEQEAFRYIQKCSMDSGTNMVETAQMILLLIYED